MKLISVQGVRSGIRTTLFPAIDTNPVVSTESIFNTEVSSADMESDPDLSRLYHNREIAVWIGPGRFVVGAAVPKTSMYFASFGDHLPDGVDSDGTWVKPGDLEVIRGRFSNFDPTIRKLLAKSQSCVKWTTATVPPLKRWTSISGKVVLLGDAAHAMLPDAGQVRYNSPVTLTHAKREFPGSFTIHRRCSSIGRISFPSYLPVPHPYTY